MAETLISVGIDVGTTTTQLVVSELKVENRASAFAVPELHITERNLRYRSPVRFTPLLAGDLVDGEGIRQMVEAEYRNAGITPETVDTGAVIITGETSRKENAGTVLNALSRYAGEFVVATAGPDLESILAAKGAGVPELSRQTEKPVLHMDIGGGTANLALFHRGEPVQTGCLNVGGRLIKLGTQGEITYLSPVLEGLTPLQIGEKPALSALEETAALLARGLEMAAGLREETPLLRKLLTRETAAPWQIPGETPILSFSGGVADCIRSDLPPLAYGDLGVLLGRAIRESRLCAGQYRLGEQTIRATVMGAGCHSTALSGSTVFYRGVRFPVKNLPVVKFTYEEQEREDLPRQIRTALAGRDGMAALAFPGYAAPDYAKVSRLAQSIAAGMGDRPAVVCLERDMAKALGHALCLRQREDTPCLCLDQVAFGEHSFLDVGAPVGAALPVIIKTLVLSHQEGSSCS